MDGLLIIDKPAGPTSHDVVARMRRVLRERRIGHTGTLDPAATGVLPLVLGRATRLAKFFSGSDKSYEAEIRLGVATDTYDAQGRAIGARYDGAWPARGEIERALDWFRGARVQQPPAFSAKKIAGRRSHRIARASALAKRVTALQNRPDRVDPPDRPDRPDRVDPPDRPDRPDLRDLSDLSGRPAPVPVSVHRLELLSVDGDRVALRVHCSAGFYVRSLAHELGERLGVGAHLAALRRTESGEFGLAGALPLEAAEGDRAAAIAAVIPLDRLLLNLPAAVLTEGGARRAAHGRDLAPADLFKGSPLLAVEPATPGGCWVRLLDHRGHLLGIAEPAEAPGLLHPSVVLM